MQQSSPGGSKPAALLLACVAGAIGGAAGALIVMPHHAATAGADDSGLRQSVHALDESVRALGTQVAALGHSAALPPVHAAVPLAEAGVDSVASADPAAVGLLLARLDEIAKLLHVRAASAATDFAGSAPYPVLKAPAAPADRGAIAELAAQSTADDHRGIWRRHAFWSCQQVLDAYGLPDQIEAGDASMGWYYEVPGQSSVHFVFFEGMLINVWN